MPDYPRVLQGIFGCDSITFLHLEHLCDEVLSLIRDDAPGLLVKFVVPLANFVSNFFLIFTVEWWIPR
jgi:hypothetical protein